MPVWNEKDLAKILAYNEEHMMPEHMEARLTLVENGMDELRAMFKEHIQAEEKSFKAINESLAKLTSELHTTNSLIREGSITHSANTEQCAAKLRREIVTEMYAEFGKRTEAHNKDMEKYDRRFEEHGRRIGDNERKLISLWDNHELTKKIQYTVAIAVVGAILKATGIV